MHHVIEHILPNMSTIKNLWDVVERSNCMQDPALRNIEELCNCVAIEIIWLNYSPESLQPHELNVTLNRCTLPI